MGLPWGQYFRSSRAITASAITRSSFSSLCQPALMAALQATVCRSSSRTVSLVPRRPLSRSVASCSRASGASSGRRSMGTWRTRRVLSPNSSTSKPSSSSISLEASSSPAAAGVSRTLTGERSIWAEIFSWLAFSFSKRIRSWAACLSIRKASSPSSTMIYVLYSSPTIRHFFSSGISKAVCSGSSAGTGSGSFSSLGGRGFTGGRGAVFTGGRGASETGSITVSRRGAADRSSLATVAAAASFFGWGASFSAAEKVFYSSAVMVRKKGSFLAGASCF